VLAHDEAGVLFLEQSKAAGSDGPKPTGQIFIFGP